MAKTKHKFGIDWCCLCENIGRKTSAEPCRSCHKENGKPSNFSKITDEEAKSHREFVKAKNKLGL